MEDNLRGLCHWSSSVTLDFSSTLTPPPPSLLSPPFCHIHPLIYPPAHALSPSLSLSACLTHTHTRTPSWKHRDCSNSISTTRWRSPLRVWVPVPGECRDKSEWVSVNEVYTGEKGGESRVRGRIGMSVRTWWGFSAMSFCLPPPSNLNNLNLCRMCHNYSSCHCTGCFSLSSCSLWELLRWLAGAQAPTEYMDERELYRGFVLSCPLLLWSVS